MEVFDPAVWSGLIFDAVSILVLALVGLAARWIGTWAKNNAVMQAILTKEELASIVVSAVEQAYEALDGPGKFEQAVKSLSAMLKSHGFKVSYEELNSLIEDAVKRMQDEFEFVD